MTNQKELPQIRGEKLYIPFVAAIIERKGSKNKEILVQTRVKKTDKKYSEKKYNNCLEIPGGKMSAYEDVFATVRREVKEECGLDIHFIVDEDTRVDVENQSDISTIIQPFCVTQMQNGPFIGLVFLCEAEGEPIKQTDETKNAMWMQIHELRKIIENTPEKFYTAFLAPIKKYLDLYG